MCHVMLLKGISGSSGLFVELQALRDLILHIVPEDSNPVFEIFVTAAVLVAPFWRCWAASLITSTAARIKPVPLVRDQERTEGAKRSGCPVRPHSSAMSSVEGSSSIKRVRYIYPFLSSFLTSVLAPRWQHLWSRSMARMADLRTSATIFDPLPQISRPTCFRKSECQDGGANTTSSW